MAGEAGRSVKAVIVLALLFAVPAAATVTGAQLREQLKVQGPAAVMAAHFQDETGGHGDGYTAVEAGSADGVAVAAALLRTVADGAVAERLHSSLGTALQRHPEHVLPLIGRRYLSADQTCLPFLSADDLTTEQVLAQAGLTRTALDRPASRHFPRQRMACLKQVRDLIATERKKM